MQRAGDAQGGRSPLVWIESFTLQARDVGIQHIVLGSKLLVIELSPCIVPIPISLDSARDFIAIRIGFSVQLGTSIQLDLQKAMAPSLHRMWFLLRWRRGRACSPQSNCRSRAFA
jgi:hypothetical protein